MELDDAAEAFLRGCLKRDPTSADAWGNLAASHFCRGHDAATARAAEMALRYDSRHPVALLLLAILPLYTNSEDGDLRYLVPLVRYGTGQMAKLAAMAGGALGAGSTSDLEAILRQMINRGILYGYYS
jgi:hypothetical protein